MTILRRLQEVVRKELLEVWQERLVSITRESNGALCPETSSGKRHSLVTAQLPYSPDLAPADILLFPT